MHSNYRVNNSNDNKNNISLIISHMVKSDGNPRVDDTSAYDCFSAEQIYVLSDMMLESSKNGH